jgi:hypothetical protein
MYLLRLGLEEDSSLFLFLFAVFTPIVFPALGHVILARGWLLSTSAEMSRSQLDEIWSKGCSCLLHYERSPARMLYTAGGTSYP